MATKKLKGLGRGLDANFLVVEHGVAYARDTFALHVKLQLLHAICVDHTVVAITAHPHAQHGDPPMTSIQNAFGQLTHGSTVVDSHQRDAVQIARLVADDRR